MRTENETVEKEVRFLLFNGLMCQNEIFNRLYPTFNGHYGRLRDIIGKVKNEGIG